VSSNSTSAGSSGEGPLSLELNLGAAGAGWCRRSGCGGRGALVCRGRGKGGRGVVHDAARLNVGPVVPAAQDVDGGHQDGVAAELGRGRSCVRDHAVRGSLVAISLRNLENADVLVRPGGRRHCEHFHRVDASRRQRPARVNDRRVRNGILAPPEQSTERRGDREPQSGSATRCAGCRCLPTIHRHWVSFGNVSSARRGGQHVRQRRKRRASSGSFARRRLPSARCRSPRLSSFAVLTAGNEGAIALCQSE